jgi:hypothetical protein
MVTLDFQDLCLFLGHRACREAGFSFPQISSAMVLNWVQCECVVVGRHLNLMVGLRNGMPKAPLLTPCPQPHQSSPKHALSKN